jgi:DNA-binding response OmpR family regulator
MNSSIKQPRILVVEDDADIRQVLCFFLKQSDFEVCTASDGRGAIDIIPQFRPHLIVLDLMMQPTSGWEVLRWLQANCQGSHADETSLPIIPVIVLTALTPLTKQVQGFEAGAVEYVTKPTQPSAIVKRIHTILSLSAEQRTMLRRKRIDEQRGILERISASQPDELTY